MRFLEAPWAQQATPVAAVGLAVVVVAYLATGPGRVVTEKTATPTTEGRMTYTVVLEPEPASASYGGLTNGTAPGAYAENDVPDGRWARHCYDAAEVGEPSPYFCRSGRLRAEATALALTFPAAALVVWAAAGATVARRPERDAVTRRRNESPSGFRRRESRAVGDTPHTPPYSTRGHTPLSFGAGTLLGAALPLLLALAAGRGPAGDWGLVAAAVNALLFIGTALYSWWRGTMDDRQTVRMIFWLGAIAGLGLAGWAL
ncbi:MAG: hypothetical protein WD058_02425 [Dehalococcoidia bacterium]